MTRFRCILAPGQVVPAGYFSAGEFIRVRDGRVFWIGVCWRRP